MILIIYDISEDDVRFRIADVLKSYGLKRIQKSAFIGRLPSHLLKDLVLKVRKVIKNSHANIQVFKLTWHQYKSRIEIGVKTIGEYNERSIIITT